jgi:uncharacterized protein (TIGR02145 family)
MKSFYLLFLVSILSSAVLAQSNIPQVVSFSAVVRDANNQPLANTPVSIRLTFKKGGSTGPLVYCALHQDVSNANGFISLQLNRNVLGTGSNGAPSTTFETIPWKEGGFWMEVEYQTVPNTPFTSLGQLELASSFYAFAAGSAEKVNGVKLDGASNGDVLSYNLITGQWEPKPAGSGLPTGTTGTMLVHNGTSWTVLPGGAQGQVLTFCNGQPTWGPCPASLATLITTTSSSITSTTASSGGNITNDGGGAVTARGVVWSTSQNPTVALITKTTDGTGTGSFTSSITGLSPGTLYYVRAYATNSAGTAYGTQQTLTTTTANSIFNPNLTYGTMSDNDGNTYKTIIIGTQTWMAENLKTTKYRNGDPIPTNLSNPAWKNTTIGAFAIYNNDTANNVTYGKLYNWKAVVDSRNLCPTGWHVPTDAEWSTLENYLGGSSVAGGKLKSTSSLWTSPNIGATNESGFSGLPGGYRYNENGFYLSIGDNMAWWSSTLAYTQNSYIRDLNYDAGNSVRTENEIRNGLSVRCLKD